MTVRSQIAALLGAALGFLAVPIASAADMPVKARVYKAPAAAVGWAGWYLGGNAGYGWDDGAVSFAGFDNARAAGNAASVLSPRAKGALAGIQAGYNWQMGSAVVGVEADYDLARIRGSDTFTSAGGTFMNTAERKINSVGTLRARAGYLPWNAMLLYVTGGLAYGDTSLNFTEVNTTSCAISPGCLSATDSGTRAGWTLGGGGEWMFAPRWSAKAEYLYVDLGSRSATLTSPFPLPVNFYTGTTKFRENIVRAGINYHF